jgi:hypothetical protein
MRLARQLDDVIWALDMILGSVRHQSTETLEYARRNLPSGTIRQADLRLDQDG